MPPTSRLTATYPSQQVDAVSPSAKSAPAALQHDMMKTGEPVNRPVQGRHADGELTSWTNNMAVSLCITGRHVL